MFDETWDRAMMKLDHARGMAFSLGELFQEVDRDHGDALYGISHLVEEAQALLMRDKEGPAVVDLAAE